MFGQVILAVDHLWIYLVGIAESVLFYWLVHPKLRQRRRRTFGWKNVKLSSSIQ
jgi:hypothetical protein